MKTKQGHFTRRPPAQPMENSSWARLPMGNTGVICYRIWMRDHDGAHHLACVNVSSVLSRNEIARRIRKAKAKLLQSIYELAAA